MIARLARHYAELIRDSYQLSEKLQEDWLNLNRLRPCRGFEFKILEMSKNWSNLEKHRETEYNYLQQYKDNLYNLTESYLPIEAKIKQGFNKPIGKKPLSFKHHHASFIFFERDTKRLKFCSICQCGLHFDLSNRIINDLVNDSNNEEWGIIGDNFYDETSSKLVIVPRRGLNLNYYFTTIDSAAAFFEIKTNLAYELLKRENSNWKLLNNLTKEEKESIPDLEKKIKNAHKRLWWFGNGFLLRVIIDGKKFYITFTQQAVNLFNCSYNALKKRCNNSKCAHLN